jgi:cytochrome P450
MDVVNVAAMLFGAGQGTIAHLLATSVRMLSEHPELQHQLRDEQDLIPDFVEEALRYDGPIKNSFRLVRRDTVINGAPVPAGTFVMLANAAMNRDPRRYDDPNAFKLGRPHVRTHLAFGRGAHTCPGASLARAEARISLERILHRLKNIRISDSQHGPAHARKFEYEPTYILRGLSKLHLEFDPA